MMKKGFLFIALFVTGSIGALYGQNIRRFQDMSPPLSLDENYEFGNKLFAQGKYYTATHFYQKVLEEQELHPDATYRLGMSYEKLRDYKKASDQFKKILDHHITDYPLLSFQYGINVKASGNCEEAISAFKSFINQNLSKYPDQIKIAKWELTSCEEGMASGQNTTDVAVRILDPSNGNNMPEFGVTKLAENKVIYTGVNKASESRKLNIGEAKAEYDDLYVNRLFSAKLGHEGVPNGELLKIKATSGKENIGSPFISDDGSKLYYTICKNGNQDCGIYYSNKKSGGKWSEPIKLNQIVNAGGSDNRHAVLGKDNANNEYIFFSSNRKGGQGGFDIWYAVIDEKGFPVEAINLGAAINTAKMEVTPYYDKQSNLLFFSSDGHQGMGHLDVYMVTIDFTNRRGTIFNLGTPINSSADDYYFSLDNNAIAGFVSSNRAGNVIANQSTVTDNIYQLSFNAPFTYKNLPDYISQVESFDEHDVAFKLFSETFYYKDLAITDEQGTKLSEDDINIDGSILIGDSFKANQMVYLVDKNQNIIDSVRTDENGKFRFRKLPGDKKYSILLDDADDLQATMSFQDDSGQELLSVNSEENEEFFRYRNLQDQSAALQKMDDDHISISGNLLKDGQPAANKQVTLLDENSKEVDGGFTDKDGKFHFRNLDNSEKYSLRMEEEDGMLANMSFQDNNGQQLFRVNSEDNKEFFNYRNLLDQSVALQKMDDDHISISGNLLKDGQAAANKKVTLIDENGNAVGSGYTDKDGKFHFRNLDNSEKYSLRMEEEDGMLANMSFQDNSGQELFRVNSEDNKEFFNYRSLQDQSVALQKMEEDQINISGNLLKDGQAAANKKVTLIDENGNSVGSGYTDKDGKFHFRNLDNSEKYSLRMEEEDGMLANMSFQDKSGQQLFRVNSEDNKEFFNYRNLLDQSVALQKMDDDHISISGNLLKDGQAAANKKVTLIDENGNAVGSGYTDKDGKFHFRNLDNSEKYSLRMEEDDGGMVANMSFQDDTGKELLSVNSQENKDFFNYRNLQDQSIALQKMEEDQISISGNLLKDGQPAANKKVILIDKNGKAVGSGYTDKDGQFHFRNLDNSEKYSLRMEDDDGGMVANMSFQDDTGKELLSVNSQENKDFFNYRNLQDQSIALQKMEEDQISISGNLLKDGQPAANKKVILIDENGKAVGSGYTDKDGQFHFRNLDNSEKYSLRMEEDDGGMLANMSFQDDTGQELLSVNSKENKDFFNYRNLQDQSVAMQKMAEDQINISGNLLKDGQPAANKKVILIDQNGEMIDGGYTDSEGKFHFKNLSNSKKYILRMENDENIKANMGFFDVDDNLLLSTNSGDNSAYFEFQDLSDQVIAKKQLVESDSQFKHRKEANQPSPAVQLRQMFKSTMTYEQYNNLVEEQGETLTKDINLRVQIGAFRKPSKRLFKNLNLGEVDVINSRGLTKFLVGNFNELEKAEALRKKAFDKGVDDAFVSVYYRGHRVALLIYNNKNKLVRKFVESNE